MHTLAVVWKCPFIASHCLSVHRPENTFGCSVSRGGQGGGLSRPDTTEGTHFTDIDSNQQVRIIHRGAVARSMGFVEGMERGNLVL